ncbi:MAG: DMT family transporter [Planctomycetaceae bacterium]|jgi:drug/metabolite transporter (DMT)-like permease|nr:DMT family transporter [Planctomycetaceae bacterium]
MSSLNQVTLTSISSRRESWAGTVFAFLSTFFYGLSNITVRFLTDYQLNSDWILFYKELLGLAILLPWCFFRLFQGRFNRISRRLIIYIVIAAVICELIGAHFQVLGYAIVGLVITVPLIQSSTLIGVAIMGRYFLGDFLSRRRQIAIYILIVAVIMLSVGKELTIQGGNYRGGLVFILAAVGAVVAGIAYSIYVVMLRYTVRKYWNDTSSVWQSFQFTKWAGFDLPSNEINTAECNLYNVRRYAPFPVTLMMCIILGIGVLIFGTCIWVRTGIVGFYNVPNIAWYIIPIAGLSNVVGFFCQIQGLRMTSALQASLIAVSQMILLSVVGFLYFKEPINIVVTLGLILTVYGVVISAKPENN